MNVCVYEIYFWIRFLLIDCIWILAAFRRPIGDGCLMIFMVWAIGIICLGTLPDSIKYTSTIILDLLRILRLYIIMNLIYKRLRDSNKKVHIFLYTTSSNSHAISSLLHSKWEQKKMLANFICRSNFFYNLCNRKKMCSAQTAIFS